MMNISQLKDAALEIQEEMVWKRKKVGHDLLEEDYLRIENKKEVREDSSYYSIAETEIDPQKLIDSLPLQEKREIYAQALALARMAQNKLNASFRDIEIRKRWENTFWNQRNEMFIFAFGCILFIIIGSSLGAIIRKGGLGMPVVISVLFFIVYYMLNNLGEKYATAGFVPSWLGMWSATLLLLPLGLFLAYKSNKDSKLLSMESYILMLKKVLSFGRKG